MPDNHSHPVAASIRAKLTAGFAPNSLDILDESHLHKGHAGHDPRGETHFAVTMVSAAFAGKSRVERQRLVYAALAEELAGRVHALRMSLAAPEEG